MMEFYRFKNLDDILSCRHAVSMKCEGEPYGLSVALHTGEEPQTIVANRKSIIKALEWGDEAEFVFANQTHSDNVVIIDEKKSYGLESEEDAIINCDALITDQKGVVLNILTADCVPLLMCDREKNVVAAVHAGWKGTQAKIASKCITAMQENFGSKLKDIYVGIGPAIGACCYEVGKEVAEHFLVYKEGHTIQGEKYMLDLPSINKTQLLDLGIAPKNIEMSGVCTSCEVENYFSYRKEQGCSGRFMSMIALR